MMLAGQVFEMRRAHAERAALEPAHVLLRIRARVVGTCPDDVPDSSIQIPSMGFSPCATVVIRPRASVRKVLRSHIANPATAQVWVGRFSRPSRLCESSRRYRCHATPCNRNAVHRSALSSAPQILIPRPERSDTAVAVSHRPAEHSTIQIMQAASTWTIRGRHFKVLWRNEGPDKMWLRRESVGL